MSPDEVVKSIRCRLTVLREDIARAKSYLIKQPSGRAENHARTWIKEQGIEESSQVNTRDEAQIEQLIRAYSLRKSFYQALFELVASGDMVLTEPITKFEPSIGFSQGGSGLVGSTVWQADKYDMGFAEPHAFERLSLTEDVPNDSDIFLEGIDNKSLHSGIRLAVEQSLACFRRGLYMPATAMLAATVEATWTECGTAVAAKLADNKLQTLFGDQYASISKKVTELCKALEQASAKPLLKSAGQTNAKLNEAQVWTTVLRDRRNALHWSKAKSFLADHSETASLLIAAPLHIATLEALRLKC